MGAAVGPGKGKTHNIKQNIMAIYIVDGKPRHGKTAWLINGHIVDWLKDARKYGYKVFSNVFIVLDNIKWVKKHYPDPNSIIGDLHKKKDLQNPDKLLYYWRNLDEWNLMHKGVIICDEATRYFNARQWQMLSTDTEIKLQQHGKEQLDIWATTQSYTRLDVSLRVLVEKFFRVQRSIGWGNKTFRSVISSHYLEDLERWERNPVFWEKDPEGNEIEVVDNWAYWPWRPFQKPYYDTNQPVGISTPMPLKHIERICEHKGCRLHKKPKISHI